MPDPADLTAATLRLQPLRVVRTLDVARLADATVPATVTPPGLNADIRVARLATSTVASFHTLDIPRAQLDPGILRALDWATPRAAGQPRSAFHLPTVISQVSPPTAATVFEDPDDASKRYALSGFRIATTTVGAQPARWVELRPGDGGAGYLLEVHLTAVPPTGAAELPPNVEVAQHFALRATLPSGLRFERAFDAFTVAGSTWTLQMHLDASGGEDPLALRKKVYDAMTASADAALVVWRTLSVAVPAPPVTAPPWRPPPMRPPIIGRPVLDRLDDPRVAARRVLDDPAKPGPVEAVDPPPPPAEPLFRAGPRDLDSALEFTFDKDLDANVFARLPAQGAAATAWNHYEVPWRPEPTRTVLCSYFQDPYEPRAVYFLPDDYRIPRAAEPPHRPRLRLSVLADGAKLSLDYLAVPVWDPKRIAAAAIELQKHSVPADAYPLQPLPASNARLRLRLPKVDPSGGAGYQEQTGASVQVESGVTGSVTMLVEDFKSAFDALAADTSAILSGFVDVTVEKDRPATSIPFTVRARKFTGAVFDVAAQPGPAGGQTTVTIRNGIESPIRLLSAAVQLGRAGQAIPTTVVSTTPELPALLAAGAQDAGEEGQAGEAVAIVVAAADGGTSDGLATCDVSALDVQPDADALLDEILDPNVPGHATRDVVVRLPAAAFTAAAAAPAGAPVAVQVEFDGASVTFLPPPAGASALLAQTAHLRLSAREFLLGLSGTTEYRYRVRAVFAAGQPAVGDWQTSTLDEIFVTLPA